jgi:hypothetical protein
MQRPLNPLGITKAVRSIKQGLGWFSINLITPAHKPDFDGPCGAL